MRRWGKLTLAVAGGGVTLAALGLWLLLGETNLDRSTRDYQTRMRSIWPGEPPGDPDTRRVALDFDSGVLRYLFLNELDDRVPYLVAFPAVGDPRAPALLVLPGGGYSFRSEKLDGLDVARWFSEQGVAAFVLNYRVAPYRYPIPLDDARRAMRWLRAHAEREGIDPERLGVMGASAGGHLAALLATERGDGQPSSDDPVERESSRPRVLILSQAVISFQSHVHEGSKRRLIGESPPDELVRALSVETRVTADTPPTFVWTTRTDGMVDYENSELLAQALERHGVEHEYLLFPEGPHGRGLSRAEKYARHWPERCLAWLGRVGFLGAPTATPSPRPTP